MYSGLSKPKGNPAIHERVSPGKCFWREYACAVSASLSHSCFCSSVFLLFSIVACLASFAASAVVLSVAFSVHSFGLLHDSMQRRATAAPHRCEPSRCRSLLCVVCELSRRPTAGLSHRDHRARRHDGRSSRTDLGLAATSLMADLPSPGSFPRVLPRRGNVSDDSQIQFLAMISQDSCHTARATKGLICREFGNIRSGNGPMLLIS